MICEKAQHVSTPSGGPSAPCDDNSFDNFLFVQGTIVTDIAFHFLSKLFVAPNIIMS